MLLHHVGLHVDEVPRLGLDGQRARPKEARPGKIAHQLLERKPGHGNTRPILLGHEHLGTKHRQ